MKIKKSALICSIGLILVLALLMAFGACAKKEAPATTAPATTAPATTKPATTTPATTKPATTTPATTAPATTTPAKPATFKWPASLTFGTCVEGGSDYTMAAAIAPVLQKTTGMQVRILPVANEPQRYDAFVKGEFDIHTGNAGDNSLNQVGAGGGVIFPKGQIRTAWCMNVTPYAWYVTEDHPIKTIYDIKTRRVKIGWLTSAESAVQLIKGGIPAFLNMTPAEVEQHIEWVPFGSFTALVSSAVEGKVDFTMISVAAAQAYEIQSSPRGIRIIEMPFSDVEGWRRFLAATPSYTQYKIDIGIKAGIGKESYGLARMYSALADKDEELIYQLAKWFDKSYDAYKDVNANLAYQRLDYFRKFLDSTGLPVHKGTIRYLREIGKWTDADDKWNNEAIDTMTKYCAAWDTAVKKSQATNIKIALDNPDWVKLWADLTQGLGKFRPRL